MTKGIKIGQGGIDLARNTSIKYLKITGQQIFHYSDNSYKTTPQKQNFAIIVQQIARICQENAII